MSDENPTPVSIDEKILNEFAELRAQLEELKSKSVCEVRMEEGHVVTYFEDGSLVATEVQ